MIFNKDDPRTCCDSDIENILGLDLVYQDLKGASEPDIRARYDSIVGPLIDEMISSSMSASRRACISV